MRLDDIAVFVLHVHYKKLEHFLRHLGQIRCFTLEWKGLAFYEYACLKVLKISMLLFVKLSFLFQILCLKLSIENSKNFVY